MTIEEKKNEMKNRISMALKDPILQQGFEIICKENAELKSIERMALYSKLSDQLTKAKKIIRALLRLWNDVMTEETVEALVAEAEQFLKEIEK